jgi:serine/threonine protein kinase
MADVYRALDRVSNREVAVKVLRGSFASVRDLIDAIRAFIDGWNERCHPFAWTKTADQILATPPAVKEHHLQPLVSR